MFISMIGLMADFDTSDEVLADVEKQLEDIPYDSEDPLYEFGYGLSY